MYENLRLYIRDIDGNFDDYKEKIQEQKLKDLYFDIELAFTSNQIHIDELWYKCVENDDNKELVKLIEDSGKGELGMDMNNIVMGIWK